MRSLARMLALALVVATASAVPALATREGGLWPRLRRIETAFRGGDAASLRLSFSAAGKVRMDLKDVTDGPGAYSAGQLQVMFGQIFAESPTREFGFREDDVTTTSSDTAFARGRWVRHQAGGRETVDTLTFTLHEESGDWRILEIRSSR